MTQEEVLNLIKWETKDGVTHEDIKLKEYLNTDFTLISVELRVVGNEYLFSDEEFATDNTKIIPLKDIKRFIDAAIVLGHNYQIEFYLECPLGCDYTIDISKDGTILATEYMLDTDEMWETLSEDFDDNHIAFLLHHIVKNKVKDFLDG